MTLKASLYISNSKAENAKRARRAAGDRLQRQMTAHERIRHSLGTIRTQLKAFEAAFSSKGESAGTVREEDALKRRYMTLLHSITDIGPAVDWLSGDHRSHYQKEGEK